MPTVADSQDGEHATGEWLAHTSPRVAREDPTAPADKDGARLHPPSPSLPAQVWVLGPQPWPDATLALPGAAPSTRPCLKTLGGGGARGGGGTGERSAGRANIRATGRDPVTSVKALSACKPAERPLRQGAEEGAAGRRSRRAQAADTRPWAQPGPPPGVIRPGSLLLPRASAELSLTC